MVLKILNDSLFGRPKWPVESGIVWFRGFTDNFEANLDDPKRNGRGTAKLPITQDANIIIFTIFLNSNMSFQDFYIK